MELWTQSLQEAENGWLSGPYFSEQKVSGILKTDNWICTRRFPNKIRLIDDGPESGLNSAYSSYNYNQLQLMDMDSVLSMVHLILQSIRGNGGFCFRLSTGQVLSGVVHPDWRHNPGLLGRTLDLTAAYKQLAVNPEQTLIRALVAYTPELQAPAYFIFNALPFGATRSVYAFNRVAKSLWHIMVSLGNVLATQYYDDYPTWSSQSWRKAQRFMEFVLQALGWKFAMDGKKASPPDVSFKVLGVQLDLSRSCDGILIVANKKDRIQSLMKFLSGLMGWGRITSSEAGTLHRQLNFGQGQLLWLFFEACNEFPSDSDEDFLEERLCAGSCGDAHVSFGFAAHLSS